MSLPNTANAIARGSLFPAELVPKDFREPLIRERPAFHIADQAVNRLTVVQFRFPNHAVPPGFTGVRRRSRAGAQILLGFRCSCLQMKSIDSFR